MSRSSDQNPTEIAASVARPTPWRGEGGLVRLTPFYYGYVMIPAAMLTLVATSPGQTFLISVFNGPLRDSLGLTHSQLTGAYMLGSFLACLPMPLVGAIQDRFGIRRTMLAVVLGLGGACMLASQARELISLSVAFFFLRMLGQGSLTMLAANTLAMWFRARLGTFMGLQNQAMALSMALMPPLVLAMIQQIGWRGAFMALGVVVWVVMLPIVLIVFRNRPEEIGQHLDGRPPVAPASPVTPDDPTPEPHPDGEANLNLKQALRTRAYWILLAISAAWAMIGTAVLFNVQPVVEAAGLDKQTAAALFTSFAVCVAGSQLFGGFLADRVPLNLMMSVGVVCFAAAIGILTGASTVLGVHGFAAALGIGQGLIISSTNVAWPRYFGRANLGKIRGSIWTVVVASASIGPFVMGFTFDRIGSYGPTLAGFAALLAPLAVLSLWATAPRAEQTAMKQ